MKKYREFLERARPIQQNKKSVFESKHVWTRNITRWLAYCEKQNTQLNSFAELKEKVSKEVTTLAKIKQHRAWVREVKESKEWKDT